MTYINRLPYLLLLSSMFTLFACSGPQEPVYKGFSDLNADMISTKRITLSGEAQYYNPNPFGGEVVSTDIKVTVNDIPAAEIEQTTSTPVPAEADFSLPLVCNIAPKTIFDNDRNGALGGIINAVLSRKADVHYQGEIVVKFAGVPITLPVDVEEEVELGK
ncbi:MAG: hypothetical protein AAFN81_09150 [Bacteroidota bacterium]